MRASVPRADMSYIEGIVGGLAVSASPLTICAYIQCARSHPGTHAWLATPPLPQLNSANVGTLGVGLGQQEHPRLLCLLTFILQSNWHFMEFYYKRNLLQSNIMPDFLD